MIQRKSQIEDCGANSSIQDEFDQQISSDDLSNGRTSPMNVQEKKKSKFRPNNQENKSRQAAA